MKIEVNVQKKYFFILLGAILIIGAGIFGYAYNNPPGTGVPSVFGHSIDEVDKPAGCVDGQFLKWTFGGWTCDDASGGGNSPIGMIGMFNGQCPAGWTAFTPMNGRFALGADAAGTKTGAESDFISEFGETSIHYPVFYVGADRGPYSMEMGHAHTVPYYRISYCYKGTFVLPSASCSSNVSSVKAGGYVRWTAQNVVDNYGVGSYSYAWLSNKPGNTVSAYSGNTYHDSHFIDMTPNPRTMKMYILKSGWVSPIIVDCGSSVTVTP